MDMYNGVSFAGLFVLMALAWFFSANRRLMNWRCLAAGVTLQLVLGLLVFHAPFSRTAFLGINQVVLQGLDAASAGQRFLFGSLAKTPEETAREASAREAGAQERLGEAVALNEPSLGFILAIQALPIIVFFAALMALLYYYGIMQWVVGGFAWLFTRLMRVSGAESLCAAGNIFVGIEATTAVRPYLAAMTRSELCTVLTAGMATVASGMLAIYVITLQDQFPMIAGHLISASILSAPAAIVMSKILVPEDGKPATLGQRVQVEHQREASAIEAVINGATTGVKLVVGICGLLIAFLGLLALVDMLLGSLGGLVGWSALERSSSPLAMLLGYVLTPLALVIGVPLADAITAGELLGLRLIATEIPAFTQLAYTLESGSIIHPRSGVIIAYALCGFAHIASLAIFVGGVAAIVPERRRELSQVALRALLAATLACLMTGAIAGTFYIAPAG